MSQPVPPDPLLLGSNDPLPSHISLRAGPLELRFQEGDLRYIKYHGTEIIRRIYAALRDRNWGTIPGTLSEVIIDRQPERFFISFTSTHARDDIAFRWRGLIEGQPSGLIRFTFEGEALSDFLRNRIGFCVLHPAACAGTPCRVERSDGSKQEFRFPSLVEPAQPVLGIYDLKKLSHQIHDGTWIDLEFAGDLFEMEDQRNWIDASFKTFCTPLRIPFPVQVKEGDRIHQEVTLHVPSSIQLAPRHHENADVTVALSGKRSRLPQIGLALSPEPLTSLEAQKLTLLKPAHVRLDLNLNEEWESRFEQGFRDASLLGSKVELALHLPKANELKLDAITERLQGIREQVARILIFQDGVPTTTEATYAATSGAFRSFGIPLGAGTNADFYQLNQYRPPRSADFIHWSMNPQVHAFDIDSIRETPNAIPAQILSAKEYFAKPLVISPISLKPRFNPTATGPEPDQRVDKLPASVDPRQVSLFAAVWTFAVLKQLCETGVESATFFETTGWRGLLETERGTPLPGRFHSRPGQLFPLFYALAEVTSRICESQPGGPIFCLETTTSDPLRVQALALRDGRGTALWLANMTEVKQRVTLQGLEHPGCAHVIDWADSEKWMFHPDTVLSSAAIPWNHLDLAPFTWLRLEIPEK